MVWRSTHERSGGIEGCAVVAIGDVVEIGEGAEGSVGGTGWGGGVGPALVRRG